MKSKFYKLLSLVLSVSLILSLCFISGMISVSAEEKVTDYYVGYSANGSGTGLTANSPVASVAEAVTLINENELVAGDTANIWIVQDIEKPALTEEKTSGTAKHNMAYVNTVANGGVIPNHEATIIIKPHEDNQSVNTELSTTYLASTDLIGNNTRVLLGGPTVVENLCLLYNSNATNAKNSTRAAMWRMNGNSLTFGQGVTYAITGKDSNGGYAWDGTPTIIESPGVEITQSASKEISIDKPIELVIVNGATKNSDYRIDVAAYSDSTNTFKSDVTIELNGSHNATSIRIGGGATTQSSIFEKNLNIKLTNGSLVRFYNGTGTTKVNGGVQIIANSSFKHRIANDTSTTAMDVTAWKNADATANADVWLLTVDSLNVDKIDFIESETGKFSVAKGYKATATNTSTGATEDSNSGVLDLSDAAGEYTVTFTEQAEKVYDYYVKAGGTGDGTSADTPAGSVSEAITKMNNLGLDETETATIYIMQDIAAPACVEADAIDGKYGTHNMAYWGDFVEHKAKIVVKPYSGNHANNPTVTTTWLSTCAALGLSKPVTLGGPTEIDGLTLVLPYGSNIASQTMLEINGKDLTLGSDFKSGYIGCNSSNEGSWNGEIKDPIALINSLSKTDITYDKAFKVTYNNNITSGPQGRIDIPAYGAGTFTFKEDVTLEFGGSSYLNSIRFGNGASSTTTFEKNLNFKFGYTGDGNNVYRFHKGSSTVTVKGGVQVIDGGIEYSTNNANYASWDEITDLVDENGEIADTWYYNVDADDVTYVNFVNGETGKISAVKDGYVATAVSQDKSVVKKADENGIINLSGVPGTYTITFAEETVETNNYSDFINYRGFSEFSGVATADGATIDNNGALANTYKKLTQDKELNVVYFGGSVTNGTGSTDGGSWRARISDWLVNNFPAATVNNYNKAIGETGTYLGCYRVARDIVSVAPDLLFIEYSINDKYDFASYERASMQFETIVRAVKKAYPDCDIVTVLVTDSDVGDEAALGELHIQAQAHEDISQKYDITTLHVGRVFAEKVTAEGWTKGTQGVWLEYMTDMVHPNNAGYDVYYQVIKEFMANCLLFSNYGECTYDVEKQELPELVNKYLFDGNVTYIDESEVTFTTDGGSFYSPTMQGITYPDYEGLIRVPAGSQDIITVNFTGTELIMLVKAGNDEVNGNKYSVRIDGGEWVSYDYVDKNPLVIAKGLEDGAHVAEIKVSPEEVVIDTDYRISGFYSRSVVKATNKLNICDLVALDESATDTTLDERDYNNDDVIDTKDISTLKKILLNK